MFRNYIWMGHSSFCIFLAKTSHLSCVVSADASTLFDFDSLRQEDIRTQLHCSVTSYFYACIVRYHCNTCILKYTHNLMQDHTCRHTQTGIFSPASPREGLHLCWTQLRGALPVHPLQLLLLFFSFILSLTQSVYVRLWLVNISALLLLHCFNTHSHQVVKAKGEEEQYQPKDRSWCKNNPDLMPIQDTINRSNEWCSRQYLNGNWIYTQTVHPILLWLSLSVC